MGLFTNWNSYDVTERETYDTVTYSSVGYASVSYSVTSITTRRVATQPQRVTVTDSHHHHYTK